MTRPPSCPRTRASRRRPRGRSFICFILFHNVTPQRGLGPQPIADLGFRIADSAIRNSSRHANILEISSLASQTHPISPPLFSQAYAAIQGAAVLGRVATGPRAGGRVVRVGRDATATMVTSSGPLQAESEGFNLPAGLAVPAGARGRLEHLCRYAGIVIVFVHPVVKKTGAPRNCRRDLRRTRTRTRFTIRQNPPPPAPPGAVESGAAAAMRPGSGDQRIADAQATEAAEVTVRAPQLVHAVVTAQGRDPCVVHLRADHPTALEQGA